MTIHDRQLADLQSLLDRTFAAFESGHVEFGFNNLARELMDIRRALGPDAFARLAAPLCRKHALYARLEQDPLTKIARQNSPGHTGRAAILDVFYHGTWDSRFEPISEEGRRLFQCSAVHSGTAVALRERRNFVGAQLDEACLRQRGCRILSLGCGHLREATRSMAVIGEDFDEFVAVDPDPACLVEARRSSLSLKITTVKAGVENVLARTIRLGTFHFIYVANAYDYLAGESARQLTSVLFGLLRAGGRLLIANHRPDFGSRAYVEAFLHWQLFARDEQETRALAADIAEAELASLHTFQDSSGHIGYLSLERA